VVVPIREDTGTPARNQASIEVAAHGRSADVYERGRALRHDAVAAVEVY
jgi:hypothetical protein